MLRLLQRHEIQVLLRSDHTQEEVAKLAGVSVSSVRRVGKEEPVEHGDDAAERAKRRIGRPSVVKKVRKFVQGTLRTRPDLDAAQILHQARLEGYRGGDSAFYGLVASLRSKGGEPVSRFEKLPTKPTKDHRRKMGLESQRPPADSSERPHHEAHEDSNSERATAVPKQGCQSTYSLRLEYVKGTPLPGCAIAEKDLLSDWHRDFAISGQHTLEQLSSVVLRILRWDPDHLYEFRIGARLYAHMGEDSLVVDMQEPGVSCDIPVKLVGLAQGDTFTYLFDFGDCHTFRLTVLAIEPPSVGQQLPVLLSYLGNDLIQSSHSRQRRALRSAQSKPPSAGPPVARRKKGTVRFVRGADRETLAQWRKSNDKRLWQKAVAILENWSLPLEEIAQKIEKSPSQLRSWIKAYNRQGLEGLILKQRSVCHRTLKCGH
jgi:hypothetical protein